MKLIHTADLHLDSALERHLSKSRAEERRNELLAVFRSIVGYSVSIDAEAILIAGDLFDLCKISRTALDAVISTVVGNPNLIFYYLRGNHDEGAFVEEFKARTGSLPDNFKTFSEEWTSYELTGRDGVKVTITGAEMNGRNNALLASSLKLDEKNLNIVMLHGQVADISGNAEGETIPIRDYRNKGIDYLALGHIHTPSVKVLDSRGKYAYCGCPEGRGFDECGERGFQVITVNSYGIDAEFVPYAKRVVYDINVDITSLSHTEEIVGRVKESALNAGVCEKDLLKARLSGEVDLPTVIYKDQIKKELEPYFYVVKVVDETRPHIDYNDFSADASLKGEFVRMIKEDIDAGKLDEETASKLIRNGIGLLMGIDVPTKQQS